MKLKLLCLFFVLGISCCLLAQDVKEPKVHLENFFHELERDSIASGFASLFSTNPYLQNVEQMEKLVLEYGVTKKLLGKYYGYEILKEYIMGSCLVQYFVLAKYERQPMRFRFVFYKPTDKWVLHTFKYDDKFVGEFNDIASPMYFDYSADRKED